MKIFGIVLFAIIVSSCVAPKDLTIKIKDDTLHLDCKDLDYNCIFPKLSFNDWLIDFNKMIADIPLEVSRNQMGLSSHDNISQMYWCFPTAKPFVQLDTLTRLKSSLDIKGDWRIKCNRLVEFKDSVSFKDSTFHRSNKLIRSVDSDDVLVRFTDTQVQFYVKKSMSESYRKRFSRHYKVLNGRYLLIYNLFGTTSGTAFVGITQDGRLIWNQYSVIMETYYDNFKRWRTSMNQMTFEKI